MHKRHFKYSWLFKALFAERACCLLLIILAQGWDKFAATQCHTSNSPFQIKAPWVRGESGPLVPGESLKLKCSSHLQELPSLAWTAILISQLAYKQWSSWKKAWRPRDWKPTWWVSPWPTTLPTVANRDLSTCQNSPSVRQTFYKSSQGLYVWQIPKKSLAIELYHVK